MAVLMQLIHGGIIMTTLDAMRQENPNSWYLKDRAARERALSKPDSGKLERMAKAYREAMGDRQSSMDVSPAPAMALEFANVPLHGKGWKDLQARIKKYKMQVTYKIEREPSRDGRWLFVIRPDAREAFDREFKAGYIQTVTGWAK